MSSSDWESCKYCGNPTPDLIAHQAECFGNPENRPCKYFSDRICEKAKVGTIKQRDKSRYSRYNNESVIVWQCYECRKMPTIPLPLFWYVAGIQNVKYSNLIAQK